MSIKLNVRVYHELGKRARRFVEEIMASIQDLRDAQGEVGEAVAALGVTVGQVAERVDEIITRLEAGQVAEADITALRDTASDLRNIGNGIADIGNDPDTEVPPPGPPIDPPVEPPADGGGTEEPVV